jgi:histone H3
MIKDENKEIENVDNEKEYKSNKKKNRFFETYIMRILKLNNPLFEISANAKQQLNHFLCFMCKKISEVSLNLSILSKKKTITEKEFFNSIKLSIPEPLQSKLLKNVNVSLENYLNDNEKHSSRQTKARLIFPPSICEKFLRGFNSLKIMITKNLPVCLASVVQDLCIEILNGVSIYTKENNRIRITVRDIELYKNKNILNIICINNNYNFLGGGVIPEIHESLLAKRPRKKKKQSDLSIENKKHRFRPGTVSIREIKKNQKISHRLTFSKIPFERYVRNIIEKYDKIKISKDVFVLLQYYIEQYIVEFLKDANNAAIHSSRIKLIKNDIDFICKLRKYDQTY